MNTHKLLELLLGAGISTIIGMLGYFGKKGLDALVKMGKSVDRIDQHLFGVQGAPGLTTKVENHEIRLEVVERTSDVHGARIRSLEDAA